MLSFSFFHTSFIGFILLVTAGFFGLFYIAIQKFYFRAKGYSKVGSYCFLPVSPFPLATLIIIFS